MSYRKYPARKTLVFCELVRTLINTYKYLLIKIFGFFRTAEHSQTIAKNALAETEVKLRKGLPIPGDKSPKQRNLLRPFPLSVFGFAHFAIHCLCLICHNRLRCLRHLLIITHRPRGSCGGKLLILWKNQGTGSYPPGCIGWHRPIR